MDRSVRASSGAYALVSTSLFKSFLLLITTITTIAPVSAQVTFTQATINSGDTATASIATGDFDNDGVLDLVTVNKTTLSFYKGLGKGTYANPANQPVSQNLYEVFAADFNRDRKLDLAIATSPSQSGGVKIFLGNGDGTFTQKSGITVRGSAGHIALADFNGDHQPDIATSVCERATCQTKVFIGRGDGTFKLATTLSNGRGPLVAGDFDADGHQDLVVVADKGIALYLGNGNGTFKSQVFAALDHAIALAVGDFYNNRIQTLAVLVDVFVASESTDVYIYSARYSKGRLLVEHQQKLESGVQAPYHQIAAGDLNGDFKDDVYLGGGTLMAGPQSAYLLGNGDGTFGSLNEAQGWGDTHYLPIIRDLNLDSRHDVAIAWTGYFESIGGAEVLEDSSGAYNCNPPKASGLQVHICAPASGQTVGQTFTFKGAGNASNGYAKRVELWIDGKKVAQNLEDQLKAKVSLPRGKHTAHFVVVDAFDNYVAKSVNFTASY